MSETTVQPPPWAWGGDYTYNRPAPHKSKSEDYHLGSALAAPKGLQVVCDGVGSNAYAFESAMVAATAFYGAVKASGSRYATTSPAVHNRAGRTADHAVRMLFGATTLVALGWDIWEAKALITWKGDSNAYLWDIGSETLSKITAEHNLAASGHANVLTRCVGDVSDDWESVAIDLDGPVCFILCTDGVDDGIDLDAVTSYITAWGDTEEEVAVTVGEAFRECATEPQKDDATLVVRHILPAATSIREGA